VQVHSAATADKGRERILVHPLEEGESDDRRLPNGVLRRADFQGRLRLAVFGDLNVCIAVKPLLGRVLSRLDLERPTARTVSLSGSNASVPPTWIERYALSPVPP
jgi:hypothetical protein